MHAIDGLTINVRTHYTARRWIEGRGPRWFCSKRWALAGSRRTRRATPRHSWACPAHRLPAEAAARSAGRLTENRNHLIPTYESPSTLMLPSFRGRLIACSFGDSIPNFSCNGSAYRSTQGITFSAAPFSARLPRQNFAAELRTCLRSKQEIPSSFASSRPAGVRRSAHSGGNYATPPHTIST